MTTVLLLLALLDPDPAVPLRLTLAEAQARARTVSPRLQQLRALQDAADSALRGARAERWPTLGVSGAYTRNSNVPEFTVPQPGTDPLVVFPNLPNQGYARADLSVPLYTGGRVGAAVSSADEQRRAAEQDASAAGQDLVLEVAASYWTLVARRDSERVLREAIASYDAHLQDTRNFFETGLAARNDVLAVQVERDRAELSRLEAENAARVESANLARLLDLPPLTRVEPAEETATATPEAEVETLVLRAQGARAEVQALRARVAAAEAAVDVAHAPSRPQATLLANYQYANPNQRIFPLAGEWRDTWALGVAVSLTAFDGGRTSAATARARAQAEALRHQLDDLTQRVRLEVVTQILDLETARAALAVAARSVEAARENVRVSQDRYQAGVNPSSDLLDAETRLLRAGLDETLAQTRVRLATARLDRAVGR